MERLLSISAGHLSAATWTWLDEHLGKGALRDPRDSVSALLAGGPTRYGWFMVCPTEGRNELPDDLRGVLDHARRRGAGYVLFDRDSNPLEDLPVLHAGFLEGGATAAPGAE